MKIAESSLQMASSQLMARHHEVSESLRVWSGGRPPEVGGPSPRPRELVQISDDGKAAQSAETQALQDSKEAVEKDPRIQLIKTVIEYLTGKTVKTIDPRELEASQESRTEFAASLQAASASGPDGYGLDYHRHESYAEYERTSFSASGTLRTTDGKEISFQLDITMERYFSMESDTRIQMGDAIRPKDPLVINFGGTAAQLSDTAFRFDLDADGRLDQLRQLLPGSGYLVLDRNKDGKINNGKELFGPTTGNGFAELSKLDEDGNGWIDENDSAWNQLQVWTPDAEGKGALHSLKEADVGAISLQALSTPFSIKNSANELLGQIVASSVYLKESGGAGSVQQVDLVA